MKNHYGIIEIGQNQNVSAGGAQGEKKAEVKFVHYPDSQQLIVWLSEYGHNYGAIRFIDTATGAIFRENQVGDILNGSIQLLFNTLDLPPGQYAIEIDHPQGWKHRIELKKLEEGQEPEKPEPVAEKEQSSGPIVYKDGFGNVIPDEDLILREKAQKKINDMFNRKIEYSGTFRAGTITYVEGDLRIDFYHEMGGGNCMFYIDIPAEKDWEAKTKTPLSRREEIVQFVAETVRRQQAPRTRYEIQETFVNYFYQ